jgi:hypothetical protein
MNRCESKSTREQQSQQNTLRHIDTCMHLRCAIQARRRRHADALLHVPLEPGVEPLQVPRLLIASSIQALVRLNVINRDLSKRVDGAEPWVWHRCPVAKTRLGEHLSIEPVQLVKLLARQVALAAQACQQAQLRASVSGAPRHLFRRTPSCKRKRRGQHAQCDMMKATKPLASCLRLREHRTRAAGSETCH